MARKSSSDFGKFTKERKAAAMYILDKVHPLTGLELTLAYWRAFEVGLNHHAVSLWLDHLMRQGKLEVVGYTRDRQTIYRVKEAK